MARHLTTALACATALLLAQGATAETFRWGAGRDIGSLDPYSYGDSFTINVMNHVYEALVRYDRDLKLEPALATSWEIVSPTVWRFKLREGVTFHNGNPFTADDVIASLTRVSHPNSPLKGNLPAYKSATKVDDYTVDIELTGAYPLLLNDLTNIHIFDAEWLKENNSEEPTDIAAGIEGYATFNANGTGPFIVESRQPEAKTVFVVNPNWWDTPQHNLTRIEFQPVTSAATRVAARLSGEIDFTDNAPVQDLPRLAASPDVNVLERTDLRTIFLMFNRRPELAGGGANPLNELKVREAMYQAIDLDLLQQKVMRGKSRVAGTIIAPEIPGFTEKLDDRPDYDPESAKALLAEAGFKDGFSFVFNCMSDGYVNEEQICQAITSMWARIGIEAKLDVAPRAVQTPKRTGGQTDVWTLGWATLPMLDSYSPLLQIIHTKDGNSGVFNWGGWSYPDIDKLIDQAGVELDYDKRMALQTEALEMVDDAVLAIPLHQQPMSWATSGKVAEMPQFPDNKPRLWFVKMK